MTPQKIYEIKGADWMKGISIQDGLSLGGIFSSATNFNPFETMGYLQPSLAPVGIETLSIGEQINYLTSVGDGGDGYVYALGDGSAAKTETFYRIRMSDLNILDYSSEIDQQGSSQFAHHGLTIYKNRIIYGSSSSIRSNTLTPAAANDKNLLTTAQTGSTLNPLSFFEGADGKLYFNNNTGIGVINVVTGTDASNAADAFVLSDSSLITKDGCNDGIYTIFIADNNEYKTSLATSRCRIFFWDSANDKVDADIIYDIPDSYLISCRYVDGKVIVIGSSGLWVCNASTPPKLIYPLTSTKLPISASAVSIKENILYWADTSTSSKIYAYGAKIGKPILFNPYYSSSGTDTHIALVSSGNYFISSTNNPRLYLLNSGTTRTNSVVSTVVNVLNQPFSLSYIKVVLKTPLTSGQSITISLYNGHGLPISESNTKSYSSIGAKQTIKFDITSAATSVKQFEEFYLNITSNLGLKVQRISVYGIPIADNGQQI